MGWLDRFRRSNDAPEAQKSAPAAPPPAESAPAPAPEPPIQITERSAQEVHDGLQAGEEFVFLDVRQSTDHETMRPVGAISLPLTELPMRMEELDRGTRYVLSCYHGYTSLQGAAFLKQNGFEAVESMSGGFSGWAAAGLPIEGRAVPPQ